MKKLLLLLIFIVWASLGYSQNNTFPTPSGNVGIGTTSPTSPLHLMGNMTLQGLSTSNYIPSLFFKRYSDGTPIFSLGYKNPLVLNSNIDFNSLNGNPITFSMVNIERMSILENGNVGIGTLSPTSKLEIQGTNGLKIFSDDGISATFRGRIGDNSSQIRFHDNANNLSAIFGHVGNELRFWTGGANQRMVITGGGNVGIGTNGPSATLEVENANGSPEINARGSVNPLHVSTSTTNNVRTKLQSVGSESAGYIGTETNHQLRLIVANDPKVGILSNGNMGIGTLAPNSKLDVRNGKIIAGTTNATQGSIVLESQYDQAGTYGSLSVLGTNYSTGGWVLGYGITPKPSTYNTFLSATSGGVGRSAITVESELRFLTAAPQSLTIGSDIAMMERMKISNEGNVGIGTTTPYSLLDVNGNIYTSVHGNNSLHDVSETTTRYIGHKSGNTGDGFTGMKLNVSPSTRCGNKSSISFQTWGCNVANSRDIMILNDDGNVGIGTTSPTEKLSVIGGASFKNETTGAVIVNDSYLGGRSYFALDGNSANGLASGGDYLLLDKFTSGSAQLNNSGGELKLATQNAFDVSIITNNTVNTTFKSNGLVSIGTNIAVPSNYKLAVGGDVIAERVVVKLQIAWPDYVFKKNYGLRPLSEVEAFVNQNNHLPDVPSSTEVADKGIDVGAMNAKLLQKVEELTLYLIEMKKENEKQTQEIEKLKLHINK